ncbi:CPBP family intramembrane glutamic endopeptidase [uncultured Clostridium sp.]|uniref:CPBP family intramembrane glutamic endopeptidase n=1 Tax=uncultured Clostridium sp. TaxID=59620 RepID=UPI003216DAD0
MKFFNTPSVMIEEAKKAEHKHNPFLNLLISIVLILISQLILIIPMAIIGIISVIKSNGLSMTMDNETLALINLFGTGFLIIICILYCKFSEKRNLRSMGLIKKGAFKEYGIGLIVGLIMFSAIVLILMLSGQLSFVSVTLSSLPIIILYFIGFMIQGASEEFLCRGFLLTSIAAKNGIILGIILNSCLFGFLHLFNAGFSILPLINIILVGVFFSVYAYRTDNIIGACAIHSMWNFAQGNIYGILVSGMNIGPSIFKVNNFSESLLSGGAFGAEGGLACTIVLIISTLLVVFIPKKSISTSSSKSF